MTPELTRRGPRRRLLAGAARSPAPSSRIVCTGAVAPEALKALGAVREDMPGRRPAARDLGRPAATRTGARDGRARHRRAALLAPLAADAALVTVLDGHPATLSWLGAVRGHRVRALGVDRFGQSADLTDLYRVHGLDAGAILDACAAALLRV